MAMRKEEQSRKGIRVAITYGAVGIIALAAVAAGVGNRKGGTPRIDLNATPTPGQTATPLGERNLPEKTGQQIKPQEQADAGEGGAGPSEGRATALQEPETTKGNDTKEPVHTAELPDTSQTEEPAVVTAKDTQQPPKTQPEKVQEELPVLNPDSVLTGLSFSAQTGMLWPVTGDALVAFSPDHLIYNRTLDNYRTTDYVLLAGAAGTPVSAAAEGIVTKISEELWTGTTVTVRVSENYEIVYGLLENVAVKEGDHVKEGTVFAQIAEPTRYFSEEGSGLYLKVQKDGVPENPMLFLRNEE